MSVADRVVTTRALRGSFAAVEQLVRHPRAPPEWPVVPSPGACSQHRAVEYDRPAPLIDSSLPCCAIVTVPPGAPCGEGFGPQASPQSPMAHRSTIGLADQVPESVGGASAPAPRGKTAASNATVPIDGSARARRRFAVESCARKFEVRVELEALFAAAGWVAAVGAAGVEGEGEVEVVVVAAVGVGIEVEVGPAAVAWQSRQPRSDRQGSRAWAGVTPV